MHLKLNQQIPWRTIQRSNFTQLDKLADFLELLPSQRVELYRNKKFPLNLPLRLAKKIKKGTLEDPILKQFLPTSAEEEDVPHFEEDPVGDSIARRSDKLIHKYKGRVLLVCTSACAMHCRYCFRQHFDYKSEDKLFKDELEIIIQDETIHEVILSGGDPLSLSDEHLNDLLKRLGAIKHVKRIRFHTRFIIGIPERVTVELVETLRDLPQSIWMVVHVNHARELDDDILSAISRLQNVGVIMLNQSVLLKGVNDSAEVLAELCETLVNHGIVPYYLHGLDRVKGASRFEVSEEKGKELIDEISGTLPGYAVPRYVKEIAGKKSKTIIC